MVQVDGFAAHGGGDEASMLTDVRPEGAARESAISRCEARLSRRITGIWQSGEARLKGKK